MRRFAPLLGFLLIATGAVRADGGTQLRRCIQALPSSGGLCDFRNRGAITAASTIVIDKPVTLRLEGTQLTLGGAPGILIEANGVQVRGSSGNTWLVQAGGLGNTSRNRNVIYGSALRDLEVSGLAFWGVPCGKPQDNNSGIKLQNARTGKINHVRITHNTFKGFCTHAVLIQNASDVVVDHNLVDRVSDGIRFSGVARGEILNNTIRHTQLPSNGAFTVAIGLDTTAPQDDGISYPVSSDITISGNTVRSYVNGEGIMVHSGVNVMISGNVFKNVLLGIGINPFNSTDQLSHITVKGNSYTGTMTPGASPTTANYGIAVAGGQATLPPSYVLVENNIIRRANQIVQSQAQGGIAAGYTDHLTIEDNVIRDSVSNGISLINPNKDIEIRRNTIGDISGADASGIYTYEGSQAGEIRSNFVAWAKYGYRFDIYSPDLMFGRNSASEVVSIIVGIENVRTVQ